jgi:hypothetical protein
MEAGGGGISQPAVDGDAQRAAGLRDEGGERFAGAQEQAIGR